MSIATDPFNIDHRLTRFLTVVWLRLLRMVGKLLLGEAPCHDELHAMSRFVASFILIRAMKALDPNPRPFRFTHPVNAPSGFARRRRAKSFAFLRTAMGATLWRRLRGRSAFAHIAALISAILNLDALTGRLIKRMKRRLTRLCPLVLVRAYADAIGGLAFAPAPQAADSS